MTTSAVRPAFPYYGGKQRLAPQIVSLMPPHRLYLEPYGGSAAVLLAKPPSKHEIINDSDGRLVAFYRAARDEPLALQRALTLTPYSRAEYQACAEDDPSLPDVERARRVVVRCSQSINAAGAAGSPGWALSTTRNQSRAGTFAGAADRIHLVAERLRRVYIENSDALGLIERHGKHSDAVLYVDPPYLASTRSASLNGSAYGHDAHDENHHRRLLSVLVETRAVVLLSAYDSPLYSEALAKWHVLPLSTSKPSANHAGGRQAPGAEVVYINRAPRLASLCADLS